MDQYTKTPLHLQNFTVTKTKKVKVRGVSTFLLHGNLEGVPHKHKCPYCGYQTIHSNGRRTIKLKHLAETETEIEVLKGMWKKQFSSGPIKDTKSSTSIETRLNEAVAKYESLKSEIAACKNKAVKLKSYSEELRILEETVTAFSEHMWSLLLDRLTVFSKEKLVFRFRDGSEIAVSI